MHLIWCHVLVFIVRAGEGEGGWDDDTCHGVVKGGPLDGVERVNQFRAMWTVEGSVEFDAQGRLEIEDSFWPVN